mmetsp:Transcript_35817/g.71274  ORF Transcript_35817/g.71274 Transcript_35817/m.71274 type:complete len:272 (-) Transcript_35817:87-902(-)
MGGGGNELQRLTSTENLLLGLAAGMGTKTLNYPLLHWKNRAQQGLTISFKPSIVYRGLPMAMLNLGGTTAVQFGLTGFFQKKLADERGALSKQRELMSSFLAGLVSGIPCSMYELTMIQQQRHGGTVLGTPARLVREFGANVIFRGTIMTMCRESLYTMSMLGGTPIIQRKLMEDFNLETSPALAAGSIITAVCSVIATHPLDTIKTCMQGDCAQTEYTSITGTGRAIVAKHGVVQGLFQGLGWRIALISSTFFLVNKIKVVIAPIMFPAA